MPISTTHSAQARPWALTSITFTAGDGNGAITATYTINPDQGRVILESIGFDPTDYGMSIRLPGADLARRARRVRGVLERFPIRHMPDLRDHLTCLIVLGEQAEEVGHQVTWGC